MSSPPSTSAASHGVLERWAFIYTESFFNVVPFHFQTKNPIAHPETHSWWFVTDASELQAVLDRCPRVNLAIQFNQDCRTVGMECDLPESLELARRLGVSYRHNCWIRQSMRGPTFMYAKPRGFRLPSFKRPDYPLELLSDRGLLLVPPSVHPTGFRYRWIRGPEQIGVLDLDELPPAVCEEWARLTSPVKERRGSRATMTLSPSLQTTLRELLLQYLPKDRHTHFNPRANTITSYMEESQGKKHLSVDLNRGCYYDFHRGQGGPIADLLHRLGCPNAPRVYPRGMAAGMEFDL